VITLPNTFFFLEKRVSFVIPYDWVIGSGPRSEQYILSFSALAKPVPSPLGSVSHGNLFSAIDSAQVSVQVSVQIDFFYSVRSGEGKGKGNDLYL
jgi:hypothetical protein